MKILLAVHCFFPSHVYGTETYTLQLAGRLREMGHDARVLAAVFAGETRREGLVTRYDHEGVPVICIDRNHMPARSLRDSFYQPELEPVFEKLLTEERPDILHVNHLLNHTCALTNVATRIGVPLFATLTDFHGFCFNGRLEDTAGGLCEGPDPTGTNCLACLKAEAGNHPWSALELNAMKTPRSAFSIIAKATGWIRRPEPQPHARQDFRQRAEALLSAYATCRAVITPTRFLEEAFRRQAPSLHYLRMPFGVDVDRSPKPVRPPGRRPVFGFIGQLAAHKGPDLLIEAFRLLPPGSATLRIYGDEAQNPKFTAQLRAAAGGMEIEFHGTFPGDRISSVLAGLDVLVVPSRWHENSPLVLLNALATHTPVVISDAAGMIEFITEGSDGFVFPMGQVQGLAEALAGFVREPLLAGRMSLSTRYDRTTRRVTEEIVLLYEAATRNSSIS